MRPSPCAHSEETDAPVGQNSSPWPHFEHPHGFQEGLVCLSSCHDLRSIEPVMEYCGFSMPANDRDQPAETEWYRSEIRLKAWRDDQEMDTVESAHRVHERLHHPERTFFFLCDFHDERFGKAAHDVCFLSNRPPRIPGPFLSNIVSRSCGKICSFFICFPCSADNLSILHPSPDTAIGICNGRTAVLIGDEQKGSRPMPCGIRQIVDAV